VKGTPRHVPLEARRAGSHGDFPPEEDDLRILSHNTFWFQGTPFSTDDPPEPDKSILFSLRDVYRALEPDVICLQEIQSRKAFNVISEAMDFTGSYCEGNGLAQYGGAILYRKGRPIADSHGSPGGTQRIWQICEVRTGGTRCLRVCNIHLPSRRQLSADQAAERRLAELSEVVHQASAPEVIAGDFNEEPGGEAGEYMSEHGYLDAAALTDRSSLSTTLGGKRADYIWLHHSLRECVVGYCVLTAEQCAGPAPGKEYLSDHLPLWVTLDLGDNACAI